MKTFAQVLASTPCSTSDALALFDSLEPVACDFMLGQWDGAGFATHHAMDGLLEAYHWAGKAFVDAENVHPLVFRRVSGSTSWLNPVFLIPALWLIDHGIAPKSPRVGRFFQELIPLFSTQRSRARLRLTQHRGVATATMVYDQLPINDVFKKVDADTVLGLMDRKGDAQPFFFVLRRAAAPR